MLHHRTTQWIFGALALAAVCLACRPTEPPAVAEPAGEAPAESLAWTPQASDLVLVSDRDGSGEIYLLAAGASEWVNLTDHPAADNWPEWSPDGSRIAFQSRRSGNLDVWVMNADGSDPVQLTDDPEHDYLPSWSPDGRRIAFTSWRNEPGDGERANHFYVMNADGTDQRRLLAESPGTSAGVAWSPDGQLLALTRKIGEQGADVFLHDAEGELVRRLTDDAAYNGSPVFSPDGSHLAFYSDDGEASRLVIMSADGAGRRVVVAEGQNWYPRWSPDGSWLVYTAAVPGGADDDLDVLAVPASGGAPITVVGGTGRQAEGRWRP